MKQLKETLWVLIVAKSIKQFELNLLLELVGRGLLQDRLPASPFWIVALVATAVLLSAGRLALLQISEGERAIDRFVAAIVDEDGGDDDF